MPVDPQASSMSELDLYDALRADLLALDVVSVFLNDSSDKSIFTEWAEDSDPRPAIMIMDMDEINSRVDTAGFGGQIGLLFEAAAPETIDFTIYPNYDANMKEGPLESIESLLPQVSSQSGDVRPTELGVMNYDLRFLAPTSDIVDAFLDFYMTDRTFEVASTMKLYFCAPGTDFRDFDLDYPLDDVPGGDDADGLIAAIRGGTLVNDSGTEWKGGTETFQPEDLNQQGNVAATLVALAADPLGQALLGFEVLGDTDQLVRMHSIEHVGSQIIRPPSLRVRIRPNVKQGRQWFRDITSRIVAELSRDIGRLVIQGITTEDDIHYAEDERGEDTKIWQRLYSVEHGLGAAD